MDVVRCTCIDRKDACKALGRRARLERMRERLQEGLMKLIRVQGKLCAFPSMLFLTHSFYLTLSRLSVA